MGYMIYAAICAGGFTLAGSGCAVGITVFAAGEAPLETGGSCVASAPDGAAGVETATECAALFPDLSERK